ncbi:MAG TPA: hypothetical protein VHM02_01620 [Thermoanaerobaculia bacterium]|nr:hypothetical protein [Thermoanaerobaculia bacterium]
MKNAPKILALTLALAAAGTGAAQPAEEAQRREYVFQNLDATIAEALFWELCGAETSDRCRVLHASGSALHVMAPTAVQRRMASLVAERDALPPSYQLQVHLLSASRAPGEPPAALSAPARQALADLSSVLGYRRFELLDSGVVETVRSARVNLAGPAATRVGIVLELRDVSGLEDEKLVVQVGAVSEGNGRAGLPEGAPSIPASNLLETSLSLELGETAVVGTTRLAGADEALVLLLTAVR